MNLVLMTLKHKLKWTRYLVLLEQISSDTEGSTGLGARMMITAQNIKATPRVTDSGHGAQSPTGYIHEYC